MKKFFFIICILLLLTIVGALFILPYGLGFIAQNKYLQILDTFSKSNPVQVTLLDYQRGWFSSNATVKIISPIAAKLSAAETLIVKQTIAHGPVFSLTSRAGEKSLLLGQGLITTRIDSALGVVDVVSWIQLDGALSGTVHAPLLRFADTKENQQIAVNNLYGVFKLSPNLKQLVAKFNVPQIAIKTGKFEQRIDSANFYYDLQKSMSGLFLGQRTLTIHSILWNTPLYASSLKFDGLNVRSYDVEKNHRINDEINIELKEIKTRHASYGPQKIVFTVNGLDTSTLLILKKEFNQLHRNGNDLSDTAFAKYQQLFAMLLSKGLEIHLKKLQIVTPWGNPSLVANMTLPQQPVLNNDFMRLFETMHVSARANMSATFLMRVLEKFYASGQDLQMAALSNTVNSSQIAQQQVSDWVNKKWLIPKDDGYQIDIFYEDGRVLINDQPFTS